MQSNSTSQQNSEQPNSQAQQATTSDQTIESQKPTAAKKAVLIILAPYILLVLSIVIYAVFNLITAQISPVTPDSGQFIAGPNLLERIINILLFLVGIISVIAIVPCLVIGIVLLARR